MKMFGKKLTVMSLAVRVLFVAALGVLPLSSPIPAHAATSGACTDKSTWCLGILKNDPAGLGDPSNAKKYIGPTISLIINGLIILTALGAFVMFIFGAFKYMMSEGDAGKTAEARKTMLYAGAGVLITAAVYLFIMFYNNLWPK